LDDVDGERLAAVGAVLSSESRAEILCALMSGTAHTCSELASHVGVAPSTASEHLGQLLDAGLVTSRPQGRYRYFALAGPEIADLLERLLEALPPVAPAPTPAVPARLAYARSCYDHLAGELGVGVHDRMVEQGHLAVTDDGVALTEAGRAWLDGLGVAATASTRRPTARSCLDWTQRRSHLGGASGAGLLDLMLEHRWLVRHRSHPRVLVPTGAGREAFATHLALEIR
jgi:DNA-binding transcriptional ArsR family regulator